MSAFTIRVELHGATWSDYEELHAEMEKRGFKRAIRGDDGVTYDLPPAEYLYDGDATKWDVLEKAKSAAVTVKSAYVVFVTEALSWAWLGLKVSDKAAA